MDDNGGDLDCSNTSLGGGSGAAGGDFTGTCPLLDDLLKDTHICCTHTHTCSNPHDYSHIHSCFHVHTNKIINTSHHPLSAPPPGGGLFDQDDNNKVSHYEDDDNNTTAESSENNNHNHHRTTTTKKKKKNKRPSGNREAVRKYREKKKARAASLEDQVRTLTTANHQLMKRLQGQADLEAEVARLKCLLVDIRGRIQGEIGSFPYQNQNSSTSSNYNNKAGGHIAAAEKTYVMSPCNMQCNEQVYCLQSQTNRKCRPPPPPPPPILLLNNSNGQDLSSSELENMRYFGDQNNTEIVKGFPSRPPGNVGPARANRKRKGATTTCLEG